MLRLISILILTSSTPLFAQQGLSTALLNECKVNRIDSSFGADRVLAGKVHCVYGKFIAAVGGESVLLQNAFKSGKFKAAIAQLNATKAELAKLSDLSDDDQQTLRAIGEVSAPKVLPPPSPTMTMGQLRDFQVGNVK